MKNLFRNGVLLALFVFGPIALAQEWNMVWQDEFTNGIGPDWVFETGRGRNGWGNNEFQYYRRENATVENGNLVITAKRENFAGASYTSARMKTQGRKSFKFGRIEARIALPSGQGLWPAFWMLGDNITSVGWPACGEIDIMERINSVPETFGTIHWSDQNNNYATYSSEVRVADPGQYHLYAIEWDENSIKWFVDDRQFHEASIANGVNGTSEFSNNQFLLLNMAVGGNFPGFQVDNSKLPAQLKVDYVRVYERGDGNGDDTGGNNPVRTTQIEAESYFAFNDVRKEPSSEGGENVGYINNGSWMAYQNINFPTTGRYLIEYRVASAFGGGRLSSDLNAGDIRLGELNIPNTGGWQNWRTISQTVNVNAGNYQFGIFSAIGGWNINWIRITPQGWRAKCSKSGDYKLIG